MTKFKNLNVRDEKGNRINVSVIGTFEIPDLEKKYIMYALINEDPTKKNGGVLIGEVVGEGENMQILGILPEEKNLVVAYYNEISTQLGDDENE